MSERKASVFVCDDLLYSISGKITAVGLYAQDIVIPTDQLFVAQLVVYFIIETPKNDLFKSITLRVEIPGSNPVDFEFPPKVRKFALLDDKREVVTFRHALLIPQPILRPGRIKASVIHEKGTLDAGGNWIMTSAESAAALALDQQ